ncbi:MAG: cryptochrome/photolyase family protein [Micrococcales bacterium]
MTAVYWFRRDNRLGDNLALNRAIEAAMAADDRTVFAFSLLVEEHFEGLSALRRDSILASVGALSASMAGRLNVIHALDSAGAVASFAKAAKNLGVDKVFATRAFDPKGVAEQNTVGLALRDVGIFLELHDSYYAVAPGTVKKPDGTFYRVYTPFHKNWLLAGWGRPVAQAKGHVWGVLDEFRQLPQSVAEASARVRAGEAFALETWSRFKKRALAGYEDDRNRADLPGTSHLSHALSYGEIHPRTLLADLGDLPGHEVFRKEIAWREFYADILWQHPHSYTDYLDPKFAKMRYDTGELAEARLSAWQQGQTGFPMVDAGMRQLLATGWMHNRVRMIVASFLVKDLHLEWQAGADWFERHLTDFDPASNAHGWQWTAGCGTDASPYFRVFNPVLQGLKFDPSGDYVRKYIPELRHIEGSAVHEPWNLIDGYAHGYPSPLVDHSTERDESLRRLEELKQLTSD